MLGPIEVRRDGRLVAVPGGKTAEVLVRLALDAGMSCAPIDCVDDVWAADADTRPQHLQSKVTASAPGARGSDRRSSAVTAATGSAVDPSRVDALVVAARRRSAAPAPRRRRRAAPPT